MLGKVVLLGAMQACFAAFGICQHCLDGAGDLSRRSVSENMTVKSVQFREREKSQPFMR